MFTRRIEDVLMEPTWTSHVHEMMRKTGLDHSLHSRYCARNVLAWLNCTHRKEVWILNTVALTYGLTRSLRILRTKDRVDAAVEHADFRRINLMCRDQVPLRSYRVCQNQLCPRYAVRHNGIQVSAQGIRIRIRKKAVRKIVDGDDARRAPQGRQGKVRRVEDIRPSDEKIGK